MEGLYEIFILGTGASSAGHELKAAITKLLEDSDIEAGEISFRLSPDEYEEIWDGRLPVVVACFSTPNEEELKLLSYFSQRRVPIIPIAQLDEKFETFPIEIKHLNGAQVDQSHSPYLATSTAILEAIGLLREQRRLFISYRRTESRSVAVQLHDELSGRGFSVFLDTHAIRPGRIFQDELWHSLCDSDVVIMLDTPGYFESKWTREEFGRTQAFGIHILRLVWPGHSPEIQADLSETLRLDKKDISEDSLSDERLIEVLSTVERLRARGIADRFTALTGKLKTEVETIGAKILGTGAYRALSIELASGTRAWVYPVVGVPTAQLMNSIARKAIAANQEGPFLVYDHVGIAEPWLDHLEWLDEYIPEVDFMRVTDAAAKLRVRIGP